MRSRGKRSAWLAGTMGALPSMPMCMGHRSRFARCLCAPEFLVSLSCSVAIYSSRSWFVLMLYRIPNPCFSQSSSWVANFSSTEESTTSCNPLCYLYRYNQAIIAKIVNVSFFRKRHTIHNPEDICSRQKGNLLSQLWSFYWALCFLVLMTSFSYLSGTVVIRLTQ